MPGAQAEGRLRAYPFYLCQTKGCLDYGKSIRREVIEAQFESLLTELKPSPELFTAARAMFSDLWAGRPQEASMTAKMMEEEMRKLDISIRQFVDRVMETNSVALITNYEKRIESLENEKALLREKVANSSKEMPDFEKEFRTAFEFLGNPCILSWRRIRRSIQKAWVSLIS